MQHALLKLVEGTMAQLPLGASGRKHPDAPPEYIDTSKILFIGGGAFEGFPEIVAKKMKRQTERTMGLRANPSAISGDPQRDYEILAEAPAEVLIESLIEYGFVPEFAGRFPIIVPLAPLTKEQMRLALTTAEELRRQAADGTVPARRHRAGHHRDGSGRHRGKGRQHEDGRSRPALAGQEHERPGAVRSAGRPERRQGGDRPGDAGGPDAVPGDAAYGVCFGPMAEAV